MRRTFASLLLLWVVLAIGCGPHRGSAKGTMELFIRAARGGSKKRILDMLAPQTISDLRKKAGEATLKAGGSRVFKPADLIVLNMDLTLPKVAKIDVLEQGESKARVRLADMNGKHEEVFSLIKIDDKWYLVLPDHLKP